jgi:hypothetical protein
MKCSRYLLSAVIPLSFLAPLSTGGIPKSSKQSETIAFGSGSALVTTLTYASVPQDKPTYQPTGSEADVFGTVRFDGEAPEPRRIDMGQDPACQDINPEAMTQDLLVNDGGLANVFVYVKDGEVLNQYKFDMPEGAVTLRHTGCQFSPRVLGLFVNQPLSIANDDPTTHNTHPTPTRNGEWNFSTPAAAEPITKTFARPEVLIPVKCNQHPWEKAYVAVLTHPFFSVTDERGAFSIRGLAPGTYKLTAWHEKLGEQTVTITARERGSVNQDFTYTAKPD